ncbi:hypothetical protein PCANB_000471 [Pneumocystis canis]|nr:hypothetical protein PCK1_000594 [Pneumocystis canis]KAG5437758.1 hypothetical protein PCANB_000471 [Pneumocystis canis]
MSKILSIDYLNDFVLPNKTCIKPLDTSEVISTKIKTNDKKNDQIKNDNLQKKLDPVSITLNDCLSCWFHIKLYIFQNNKENSGCITSAESVFITSQSYQKVNSVIQENISLKENDQKILVASISPQSRASLAAVFNLSINSTHARLIYFFTKILPFSHFVDTNFGRELALFELSKEFIQRYKAKKKENINQTLPLLTSACPGWICYAEKTHVEILPYISHVKSPQQITGAIIKSKLSKSTGKQKYHIYHVSIMPCFDKKLEASRDEFSENGIRDVDCVITTSELLEMLKERSLDLQKIPEAPHDSLLSCYMDADIMEHQGSSSGGYLTQILTFAAQELFNISLTDTTHHIITHVSLNNDMKEYILTGPDNSILLRMATCYGFRNIQNLIRKLKSSKQKNKISQKINYDFVEIMACPSGCINGGGQLKPEEVGLSKAFTHKEWIDHVNKLYHSSSKKTINTLLTSQCIESWDPNFTSRTLYTTYRSIPRNYDKKINQDW